MLNYCVMCFGLHVCGEKNNMQNIVQTVTAAKLYVFGFFCCDIGCSFQVFVFRQRVACLKILGCVFLSELTLIKAIIHMSVFEAVDFLFLCQVSLYFSDERCH